MATSQNQEVLLSTSAQSPSCSPSFYNIKAQNTLRKKKKIQEMSADYIWCSFTSFRTKGYGYYVFTNKERVDSFKKRS